MTNPTPLEQAVAFLQETKTQPPAAWIGKAWGADGDPRYLTYATVRALVEQIRFDEHRMNQVRSEALWLQYVAGVHDMCGVCDGALNYVRILRGHDAVGHMWLHRDKAPAGDDGHDPEPVGT